MNITTQEWNAMTETMQTRVMIAYDDWSRETCEDLATDEIMRQFLESMREWRHRTQIYPVWAFGFAKLLNRYADPLESV